MKAILEFDLPSEDLDFDMSKQGVMATSVLFDLDSWLEAMRMSGDIPEVESAIYGQMQFKLRTLCSERRVRYDDKDFQAY